MTKDYLGSTHGRNYEAAEFKLQKIKKIKIELESLNSEQKNNKGLQNSIKYLRGNIYVTNANHHKEMQDLKGKLDNVYKENTKLKKKLQETNQKEIEEFKNLVSEKDEKIQSLTINNYFLKIVFINIKKISIINISNKVPHLVKVNKGKSYLDKAITYFDSFSNAYKVALDIPLEKIKKIKYCLDIITQDEVDSITKGLRKVLYKKIDNISLLADLYDKMEGTIQELQTNKSFMNYELNIIITNTMPPLRKIDKGASVNYRMDNFYIHIISNHSLVQS